MTLSRSINTLEAQKFQEVETGKTAVRVVQLGSFINVPYDSIQATYPTSVTEVFTYFNLGASVAQVTVTYTDATKKQFLSVTRS